MQSKGMLVDVTVRNGARSLAAEIDDYLISLAIANASANNATTADPLDDLSSAKKDLDDANTPRADRFAVISSGFTKALLGDSNVINVDKYGSENPIQAGFVSRIYGFTVLESTSSNLANDGFIAMSKQCLGFARQIMPKFERQRQVLGQKDDYALSHLYGAVARDASGDRVVDYTAP